MKTIPAENLTIPYLFDQVAGEFSGKTALQVKEGACWKKISFAQLKERALKISRFLTQEGLKKGDFAALLLDNRPEWPQIYLGMMYAGVVCVPLDRQAGAEQVNNFILSCNAKILFCSEKDYQEKVKADILKSGIKAVILDSTGELGQNCVSFSQIDKLMPLEGAVALGPQDTASLIYTSGTTAQPKGVVLSHRNICSNFLGINELGLCLPSDNFLSLLPLHHTYPFMVGMIVPLFSGATITFPGPGFKMEALADLIKEAEITFVAGVPQLFYFLLNAIKKGSGPFLKKVPGPFLRMFIRKRFGKALRIMVSGGARLEPQIAGHLVKAGLKIAEGYGLTETAPVVTFNPIRKVKFGSVGKPIPGVEIRILDPDSKGEGQILIKGPNVMEGYFKQPELTAAVIKDGWFYSGDLGYIDKEGYLFITGRQKEVIILSSGKTVYPEELENYYRQIPYIKEVCILEKQGEAFGNPVVSLYAVVVPELASLERDGKKDITAAIRWELENLAKKLPPYKHIMGFSLAREDLPKTALNKIERYKIKARYLQQDTAAAPHKQEEYSAEELDLLDHDVTKKIIRHISNKLKKPVSLNSHLEIDLGIDSLSKVELGLSLEVLLSIKIPEGIISGSSTVKEVVVKIIELADSGSSMAQAEQKTWGEILKELPPQEIAERIKAKQGIFGRLLNATVKAVISLFLKIFWFLRVEGKKNLPRSGPYLICPNHGSYLDGPVVFSALTFKLAARAHFIGYSDIFEHPLLKLSVNSGNVIPIDPGKNLTGAMQAASFAASLGKIICIFPEGRRSPDGSIGEFKKGVGILIKELDIPVIPVYIKGSYQSWPRTRALPLPHPLKIIFGKPVCLRDLIKAGADSYEAIAGALREEVLKLQC
ncbi:MAG: AMP-binding protein [Candidatus Omnitrophica bacterium]|nr:AMP-binding protein [Candidatus Omnitrophota bacterium]